MIDVVIPLGKHSPYNNLELRYCLRAIEKHLTNYRNVYIIGECPSWLQNIIHIPASDTSSHEINIMRKILVACNEESISEQFILFNDDHFLIDDVDAEQYPYYYYDDLNRKVVGSMYRESCNNTRTILQQNNFDIKYFDIHCPIIYNKFAFKHCMESYNWDVRSGYVLKSLYCNTFKIVGEEMKDCKIKCEMDMFSLQVELMGRHVFSVGDLGFQSAEKYLKQEFDKPSKFEKW